MPSLHRNFLTGLIKRAVSNHRTSIVLTLLLLAGILGASGSAHAQFCPAPWSSSPTVYGVITLQGTGTSSSSPYTQTINQNVVAGMKMVTEGAPCGWVAVPGAGFGSMADNGTINDQIVISGLGNCTQTDYFTAGGNGTIPSSSLVMSSFTNQYGFGFDDSINGVSGTTGCGDSSLNAPIGFGSVMTLPLFNLPASAPLLFGTYTYASPALDIGGSLNANWTVKWIFTPVPDAECKPCKKHNASDLSIQDQGLGEDIRVIGTDFFLHYESGRSPGHAGADLFAVLDAHSLGGWTLNIHHVFEPLLQLYCAGGSCTPYATIPKALFLGDGTSRNDADVQAATQLNGNYYVTSEDGSEVYVFSPTGLHLQTVFPMTGAVEYTFAYDSAGRLIKVTDATKKITTIQRDASGNPTTIIGPFGQKTILAVDANGFLSQATDPAGNITKLTNNSLGLLTSLTDPNGNVSSFQYEANGRLTKDSDPAGGVINLGRVDNATGYQVTKSTALGRTSTFLDAFSSAAAQTTQQFTNVWDNGLQASESDTQTNGQLTETLTLPDGTSVSTTKGPDPRWGIQVPIITSQTITQGNLTMNATASRTADFTAGNPFSLVTQTDMRTINGRVYNSVYTALNRTYVDTTPAGRMVKVALDTKERLSSAQLVGLASNHFTYDTKGRMATFAQGARKYTFTYDANGFLASFTDPLSHKATFTYDADGHPLSATLPDGRIIGNTVDANGNLTSLAPPGASPHSFAFSPVNLPVSYTPPAVSGSGASSFTYNADRDLTKFTRPDGAVINYTYDITGRLTTLTVPTETVNYTYDGVSGNLNNISVAGGEGLAYGYNGPLPISSTWTGTVAGGVSRTYDNNFWTTSESVTGGSTVNFTRDNDGLATAVGALALTRNVKTGLVSATAMGNAKDTRTNNTFKEFTAYTAKYKSTTLYSAKYTRDNLGQVLTNTETIGGVATVYAYSYDTSNRLIGVTANGTATSAYTYDNNSNRLSATTSSGTVNATYDAQDRMLTYGSASYTYTANGELASKTVGAQNTTYQYDVLGNLTSATLPGGTHVSYIIDGDNDRVGKMVNGVLTTGFLYDGGNIVALLNSSNQVVSQFVYSDISDTPEYMISGGVNYRIFSDQLGSPRVIVNPTTGQIIERIDYDEFGNVINDTNPGFQPFGFAGGLYDQDTKLVRFGARDYDASTGRWTAKDPTLFAGHDTNLYSYVSNNPVNHVDIGGNEGSDASDFGMSIVDAYFTSIGMGFEYGVLKDLCKGIAKAQDDGLTEAIKDGAMKKAQKVITPKPREEYGGQVKNATQSADAVGKNGNALQKAANGINDGLSGAKPCPKCKAQPAPRAPDPKPDNSDLRKAAAAGQAKRDAENAY